MLSGMEVWYPSPGEKPDYSVLLPEAPLCACTAYGPLEFRIFNHLSNSKYFEFSNSKYISINPKLEFQISYPNIFPNIPK